MLQFVFIRVGFSVPCSRLYLVSDIFAEYSIAIILPFV